MNLIHAPFFDELTPGLLVVIEANKFQNAPIEPGVSFSLVRLMPYIHFRLEKY